MQKEEATPGSPAVLPRSGLEITPPPIAVPDHTLIRRIGRGSYGEVWLARNVMGAWRAVKIVHRRDFDHDRPFERELGGIERFEPISRSHPSQLNILHVGRGPDCFYYVMELADDQGRGQNIDEGSYCPRTLRSELLEHGRLPYAQCLEMGVALTTALQHLHQYGLVHRDIKPSNIVFVNGIPKLADIGLVARADATVSVVGTEGYLPPEGPGTAQADVFSLGKVLYEMSTGQDRQQFPELPTNIASMEEREQIAELNQVVLKACDPDPRQRYQSAAELQADLALLQSGQSVTRMRTMERRLRFVQRTGALVTALAALIAAGWWWQAKQTHRIEELAGHASRLADESRDRLVTLQVENGNRAVREGDLGKAFTWYAQSLRHVTNNPAREEVHRIRIASVLDNIPKMLHQFVHTGAVLRCAFSPDNSKLASLESLPPSGQWQVRLFELASGDLVQSFMAESRAFDSRQRLQFSPDGDRLFLRQAGFNAQLWDIRTGKKAYVPAGEVSRLLDTADGRQGVVLLGTGEVQLIDLNNGTALSPRLKALTEVRSAYLQESTNLILLLTAGPPAADGEDQTLLAQVWRLHDGLPLGEAVRVNSDADCALTRDGAHLAITTTDSDPNDRKLRVLELASGEWKLKAPVTDYRFDSFVPTAFGLWAVLKLPEKGFKPALRTTLWNLDTQKSVTLEFANPGRLHEYSFSPDGLLVTSDGRVWSLVDGAQIGSERFHGSWIIGVAFAPNGRLIATAGEDRRLCVWDIANIPVPEVTIRTGYPIPSAAFCPDGERIVTLGTAGLSGETWNVRTGKRLTQAVSEFTPHPNYMVVVSPDGKFAASCSEGFGKRELLGYWRPRMVLLWRLEKPEERVTLDVNATAIQFSRDSTRLLTAQENVQIWNVSTGAKLLELPHKGVVSHAAFSPDESKLLSVEYRKCIRIWDAKTGENLQEIGNEPCELAGWSPDGKQIAISYADQCIRVWDLSRKTYVTPPLRHGGNPNYVSFSPNGRLLMSHGVKTAPWVKVWDPALKDLAVPTLEMNGDAITDACFSSSGTFVAAASRNGAAVVYNTATGEPACIPLRDFRGIYTVQFSPDSERLLTAGHSGVAKVWRFSRCDYPAEDVVALAELYLTSRVSHTINLHPIETERLDEHFRRLVALYPQLFQSNGRAQVAWHEQMAEMANQGEKWESVVWHLNRALELNPDLPEQPTGEELLRRRGHAFGELGRFADARRDFARAVQLDPDDFGHWEDWMMTLFAQGLTNRYAEAYKKLCDHFSRTNFPQSLLVGIAARMPGATPDVSQSLALLGNEQGCSDKIRGQLLLRAARYSEALTQLESVRTNWCAIHVPDAELFFSLAMASHGLGKDDEAKGYFNEGVRHLSESGYRDKRPKRWYDRVVDTFLMKEAGSFRRGSPEVSASERVSIQ